MNTLTYKGYTARIDFDDRDNSLVGRLLGIQDIIGFHADNVADLGILHSSVYTFSNYRRVGRVSESVTRQIVLSVSGYG